MAYISIVLKQYNSQMFLNPYKCRKIRLIIFLAMIQSEEKVLIRIEIVLNIILFLKMAIVSLTYILSFDLYSVQL